MGITEPSQELRAQTPHGVTRSNAVRDVAEIDEAVNAAKLRQEDSVSVKISTLPSLRINIFKPLESFIKSFADHYHLPAAASIPTISKLFWLDLEAQSLAMQGTSSLQSFLVSSRSANDVVHVTLCLSFGDHSLYI